MPKGWQGFYVLVKRSTIAALLVLALFQATVGFAATSEKVVLDVQGMYCESCAKGITAMLKRVDGVTEVDVSFEKREANVTFAPDKTSVEKLIEAIEKLGYKAAVKK